MKRNRGPAITRDDLPKMIRRLEDEKIELKKRIAELEAEVEKLMQVNHELCHPWAEPAPEDGGI